MHQQHCWALKVRFTSNHSGIAMAEKEKACPFPNPAGQAKCLFCPLSVLVYKDKMYHKMITQKKDFLFNSFLGYSLLLGMKVMKPSIDINIFPDRMWCRWSSDCKTKDKFAIGFQNIKLEIQIILHWA